MSSPTTLVTGVSRGIGAAIAELLAERGHAVVGLARKRAPAGTPGHFYDVDLADRAATATALARILERHDIDNLVNNAGVISAALLEEVALDELDHVMDVNLRAALQCAQACLPGMRRKKRGRIVNIGSRVALGKARRTVYGASKAALAGMTRTWALELARDGITVNCVAPGPIETELFRIGNPPESPETQAVIAGIPVGRMGAPREVAAAVAYFLSEDAGYVTGQVLHVCGGTSVGLQPV